MQNLIPSIQGSLVAVPADVLEAINLVEAARLGFTPTECAEQFMGGIFGYIPNYMTDSPGFVGEVVVAVWPAGPNAITSWMRAPGKEWEFNVQTSW